MEENTFSDKTKAIDYAVWMSFKHKNQFVVVEEEKGVFQVLPFSEKGNKIPIPLPSNYKDLSYEAIEKFWNDKDCLWQWQWLMDMFLYVDHTFLHFLIEYEIPLEKVARYSMAFRKWDENKKKISYKESKKMWLK